MSDEPEQDYSGHGPCIDCDGVGWDTDNDEPCQSCDGVGWID